MALEIGLLGEEVVIGEDGAVRLRSSRTLTLLAYLVVHHRSPQPRQRIARLFWPDSTDEQGLTNLRRELHHLRAVLAGDSSLVVTSKDLCWSDAPTSTVDVRRFLDARVAALRSARSGDTEAFLTRAAAALDAYRGEFLPGSLDDWVLEARSALEQQCVELVDAVIDARAGGGDLAGAVAAGRRRLLLRPLEETGYRRLMELQGELGDRAGAVSTFHRCASVLEAELGVEPDPLTRRTVDRLLDGVRPVAPARAGAVEPGPVAGPAAARFTGRTAELRKLQKL
jgi:DNA-binding SARP family transcriptional activator